jgi:hypothetical protein
MRGGIAHCNASLTTGFHGQFVLKAVVSLVVYPLVSTLSLPYSNPQLQCDHILQPPLKLISSPLKNAIDRFTTPSSPCRRAFSKSTFLR